MIYLAIQPFYVFSISLIVLCILYIVFISVIYPTIKNNKVKKLLINSAIKENKKIVIIKEKSKGSTFKIKIEDKIYSAKVIYTRKNCDLQINNFETWVMYIKSADGTYKTKTVSNMSEFMNSKDNNKIVLLANKAKTIKKVINECEMIMVNPTIDVFGVNVYNYNDYSTLFK